MDSIDRRIAVNRSVLELAPDGSFPSSSGTSWAAAHVSGVAALLRPLMPLAKPSDLVFLLTTSTRDLGTPGKDALFGHGLVDACRAAATATGDAVTCEIQGESHVGR